MDYFELPMRALDPSSSKKLHAISGNFQLGTTVTSSCIKRT